MGENPYLSRAGMDFFPGGLRLFELIDGVTVSARIGIGKVNNIELNLDRSWIMSVTFA